MKFSKAPLFLLSAAASLKTASSAEAAYHPVRIDYKTLANNKVNSNEDDGEAIQLLMGALRNVGMVSVTNFPSSFRRNKKTVQAYAGICAQVSEVAKTHVFEDGTMRTTSKFLLVTAVSFIVYHICSSLTHHIHSSDI